MVGARSIVFAAAGGVGECVVGVVNELELARSLAAFWGVVGHAVGVCLQRCSVGMLVTSRQEVRHIYLLYASRICCEVAVEEIPRAVSEHVSEKYIEGQGCELTVINGYIGWHGRCVLCLTSEVIKLVRSNKQWRYWRKTHDGNEVNILVNVDT